MYKTLLLACALIAPVMAQDAPAPEPAKDAAPAARPARERGPRMDRGALIEKLVMDKYDANKDGKLDDAEKAKIKADAAKIREERAKARTEKGDQPAREGEGRGARRRGADGANGAPGERGARRGGDGARPEGGPRGERGPRPEGAPRMDRETMIVGQALLMEKYDANKNGKIDKEEADAIKKDLDALKKPAPEKAPEKAAE